MLQYAREIAPSVSWDILVHVKRTGGISVNELAALLKMSYMGVKQHCDDLKKRGYVDTWRRPKGAGRPEKIFRPTSKLDLMLPNWGNDLSLGILGLLAQLNGDSAAERLLYSFLQQKSESWSGKPKGNSLKDRAEEFVRMRNHDGWMSQLVEDERGLYILEHHSPLQDVGKQFPSVWEMETRLLERLFGHEIRRHPTAGKIELRFPGTEPAAPSIVVDPAPNEHFD